MLTPIGAGSKWDMLNAALPISATILKWEVMAKHNA